MLISILNLALVAVATLGLTTGERRGGTGVGAAKVVKQ